MPFISIGSLPEQVEIENGGKRINLKISIKMALSNLSLYCSNLGLRCV